MGIYPKDKVTQDIHVVDECVVWRIVGAEILMHRSVRKELGTDVIKVIRGL